MSVHAEDSDINRPVAQVPQRETATDDTASYNPLQQGLDFHRLMHGPVPVKSFVAPDAFRENRSFTMEPHVPASSFSVDHCDRGWRIAILDGLGHELSITDDGQVHIFDHRLGDGLKTDFSKSNQVFTAEELLQSLAGFLGYAVAKV